MNPFGLNATGLLVWGLVAHLVADWLLQNEWLAVNKTKRRHPAPRRGDGLLTPPRVYLPPTRWWDRHPAAYVHAGIHAVALALVFGLASLPLAVAHLVIDTRVPVEWWSRVIRQTQPKVPVTTVQHPTLGFTPGGPFSEQRATVLVKGPGAPVVDLGMLVRMANDQAWHVATIAIGALVVGALT